MPPIPAPLDHLGQKPFSFYPPIVGIEHNEWLLKRATWSELLVSNTGDSSEIWVPRRFLGQVSSVDEPVLIVGLLKELEYKAGQVLPHVRRVIEMPRAVGDVPRQPAPSSPFPATASTAAPRSRPQGTESRMGRFILWALAAGLGGCVLLVILFRAGRESHIVFLPVLQSELGFTPVDDYHAVLRKFGPPAADRWRSEQGELQYRVLDYPQRGVFIVLMGSERDKATYIGALDRDWRVVDSVSLRGGSSEGLLKSLKRF